MALWQQSLLNKITLEESFCYLVHDPDNLCSEPFIQQAIQSSPATFVSFDDPVAVRLNYEQWLDSQSAQSSGALILIHDKNDDDQQIPWDIEQQSKALDFHINNIIPEVNSSVLRELPSTFYGSIRTAIDTYKPGMMSELASLAFVLRHVFKIAPEIIQDDVDLIRLLIRKHYLSIEMPERVEAHLVSTLGLNKDFHHWQLNKLVTDKLAFFNFLQEQWSLFLQSETGVKTAELITPFNDHDIRVFINNLFAEGFLSPIPFEDFPDDHWARIGIVSEHVNTTLKQYKQLFTVVDDRYSKLSLQEKIRSMDWGSISQDVGRLKALSYELSSDLSDEELDQLTELEERIESLFNGWIQSNYSGLLSEPAIKTPVIVHKVTPWLRQKFVDQHKRICLLVMDGMGFQQWPLVKRHIQNNPELRVEDGHCFAWVPTITSISRQALFAGKAPYYFPNDLLSTRNEGKHWSAFWKEAGLNDRQIAYQKTLEQIDEKEYLKLIGNPRTKALGAVINFIDDQMHGIKEVGMAGLNSLVDTWLVKWNLSDKIDQMVQAGFEVVITADHGSQECSGSGRISDGSNAETKGERVRIYNHKQLLVKAADDYEEAVVEWPPSKSALPADVYPMLSNSQSAFIQKGRNIVGHGGIGLHEVIVPLAVIRRRES